MSLRSVVSTLFAAALIAASGAPRAAHAQKGEAILGYVNLQRAILEVEEGKRAAKALKVTFDEKQKKLTEREQGLVKMKEALEREAKPNDPETPKKVAEFQGKLAELRKVFVDEQTALQEAEQKQLSGIRTRLRDIIEEIGKQGGYTIILEVQDSRLLYAKPHLDLTNEVIRKYNLKHK